MTTDAQAFEFGAPDDIADEMAMLMQLLDGGAPAAFGAAAADVDLVQEAVADAAPRDTYRVMGPTLTKVAAAGIATLPAVLAPVPAFAGVPMPPSLMVAMAARPAAPPAHDVPPALAATGPQLFPFTRPMQVVRASVAPQPATAAAAKAPQLTLNPRLRSMFSEQRQVAITTKRAMSVASYKVKKGDSLYSIAAEALGSGARWREIYESNKDRIGAGYLLQPGQRLAVTTQRPAKAEPQLAAKPAPVTMPTTVAFKATVASSAAAAKGYHVAPGDNLYTIAAKQLGDATRWKEIVALNKATLNGRTVIFPNQWLTLPSQV